MRTENTRIENLTTDSPNIPEDRMQEKIARRAEKSKPQVEYREEKFNHLDDCYSAWSKSKSKEQNFGFGPKQNTKVTLKPPTHHHRKLLRHFQAT